MNAIEVKNLTKKFGEFISVNNVSFTVKEGTIFGFLGANGAGKTTTIRMMCGLLEPTSGDAIVSGYSVTKDTENVKKNIGYMSQKFSLYDDLTISENIDFFAGVYGLRGNVLNERKKWAISISNLAGKENILTGSLPAGIKQRLALSVSVLHNPKVLFLDEPTSGVDPISRRAFWELISNLSAEGTTVLVTTHYLEEAEFCSNIILMDAGKIVAEGNPKQLKETYIPYPVYEITSKSTDDIFKVLLDFEGKINLSFFGNSIHITTEKNVTGKVIKQFLVQNNFAEKSLTIDSISPSLEDVFIKIVEKK
ncbi:MAG: ABC transporter ATP-binding protein [Ignavibacteriaceae bacterium]|nr:ABC transporter ATP-binding protein [Ignavibacteriaceae bacterium]